MMKKVTGSLYHTIFATCFIVACSGGSGDDAGDGSGGGSTPDPIDVDPSIGVLVNIPSAYEGDLSVCFDMNTDNSCEADTDIIASLVTSGQYELALPDQTGTYSILALGDNASAAAQYPLSKSIALDQTSLADAQSSIEVNLSLLSSVVSSYYLENSASGISAVEQQFSDKAQISTDSLQALPESDIDAMAVNLSAAAVMGLTEALVANADATVTDQFSHYQSIGAAFLSDDNDSTRFVLPTNLEVSTASLDGANELLTAMNEVLLSTLTEDNYPQISETFVHVIDRWQVEGAYEPDLFTENVIDTLNYCVVESCDFEAIAPEFVVEDVAGNEVVNKLSWATSPAATGYRLYAYENDVLVSIYDVKEPTVFLPLSSSELTYRVSSFVNSAVMDESEAFIVAASDMAACEVDSTL